MDTQARNKAIQVSFSLILGILLFSASLIFFYMFPTASSTLIQVFLFALLPSLTYLFTLGINSLVQFLSCNTVNIKQVALSSFVPVGFLFLFGGLAYFLPTFLSPIQSAITWMGDSITQYAIAIGFYLFWAGAYGESIAVGMVTSCPK
jgi:hypothetical protein